MSETESPNKIQSPVIAEDHPNIVEEQFEDNQGGQDENQGGHQDEDFFGGGEQAQYQDAGANYDDFGGANNQDFGGADNQDFGQTDNQGQNQAQAGGNEYDDFFGGGQSAAAQPQGGNLDQQYGQPAYGGNQGMGGMYGENYDPEEEERQEKLRRREQERIQALDEKARVEREKKQEKIVTAAKELSQWHSEREQNIQKKKQINKDNQEIQNNAQEEDFKNPWDKIVANIAVKEGEYPGTKDVTRFKQSLQNKKLDASRGLDADIGF